MEKLKAQDKTRTATYRQLMGQKLTLGQMLETYRVYGLLDPGSRHRKEPPRQASGAALFCVCAAGGAPGFRGRKPVVSAPPGCRFRP